MRGALLIVVLASLYGLVITSAASSPTANDARFATYAPEQSVSVSRIQVPSDGRTVLSVNEQEQEELEGGLVRLRSDRDTHTAVAFEGHYPSLESFSFREDSIEAEEGLQRHSHSIELLNLPHSSAVEVRHSGVASGRVFMTASTGVDRNTTVLGAGTDISFEVRSMTPLQITGASTHVSLNFADHYHLSSPIILDSVVDPETGIDKLVVHSEMEDFVRTELHLPLLRHLHIIDGPSNDTILLRHLPSWFNAALVIDNGHGEDEVIVEEELDSRVKGLTVNSDSMTVRAALAGPCPVNIFIGTAYVSAVPCVCTGTDSISITAAGIVVSGIGLFQTDDGDITLSAPSSIGIDTVSSSGIVTNGFGTVSITATGPIRLGPFAISGSLFVTASSSAAAVVQFLGDLVGNSPADPAIMNVSADTDAGSGPITSVLISGDVQLTNYQVTIEGNVLGGGSRTPGIGVQILSGAFSVTSSIGGQQLRVTGSVGPGSTDGSVGIDITGVSYAAANVRGTFRCDFDSNTNDVDCMTVRSSVFDSDSDLEFSAVMFALSSYTAIDFTNVDITLSGASSMLRVAIAMNTVTGSGNQRRLRTTDCLWNAPIMSIDTTLGTGHAGLSEGFVSVMSTFVGGDFSAVSEAGVGPTGGRAILMRNSLINFSGQVTMAGRSLIGASSLAGILLIDTDIVAGNLDMTGVVDLTVGQDTDNHGIRIENAAIFLNSVTGSNSISGIADGDASENGLRNHGVVFVGSCSITASAPVSVTGVGGTNSEDSHGVLVSSGANLVLDSPQGAPINVVGTGGSMGLTLTTPNHGIKLSGEVQCVVTDCVLSGQCVGGSSSVGCNGVSIENSLAAVFAADITVTGFGGTAAPGFGSDGIFLSVASQLIVSSGTVLTMTGAGGTTGGDGINMFGSFVGSDATVVFEGTGGGGVSPNNVGVRLVPGLVLPSNSPFFVTGTGGAGSGDSNYGISVSGTLIVDSDLSLIGAGQGLGSDAIGVVVDTVSASGGVYIDGRSTSSGSGATGVDLFSLAAGDTVNIIGIAGSQPSSPGCIVRSSISTLSGLSLTCTASGSDADSHGLLLPASTLFEASPVTITGRASSSSFSSGVRFAGGTVELSDISAAVPSVINGIGYKGIDSAAAISVNSGTDLRLEGNAVNSDGAVGVDLFEAVSGAAMLTIDGFGGGPGCNSGCLGVRLFAPVSCSGDMSILGFVQGASSAGVRLSSQLNALNSLTISGEALTTQPFSSMFGVDIQAAQIFVSPTTISGTSGGGTVFNHGVRIQADMSVDDGGTLNITGNTSGASDSSAVIISGDIALNMASNTLVVDAQSDCTGGNCSGFFYETGNIVCNEISTSPCSFDASGVTIGGIGSYGILSTGVHDMGSTTVTWVGLSTNYDGVGMFFDAHSVSGSASFSITGVSGSRYGVRCTNGSPFVLGTGDLIITGSTGGTSLTSADIFFSFDWSHPFKTSGLIEFNGELTSNSLFRTEGPHDITFSDGLDCDGCSMTISTTGVVNWYNGGVIQSAGTCTFDALSVNLNVGNGTISVLDTSTLVVSNDIVLQGYVVIEIHPVALVSVNAIDGGFDLYVTNFGLMRVGSSIGSVEPLNRFLPEADVTIEYTGTDSSITVWNTVSHDGTAVFSGPPGEFVAKAINPGGGIVVFTDILSSPGPIDVIASGVAVILDGTFQANSISVREGIASVNPFCVMFGDFTNVPSVYIEGSFDARVQAMFDELVARDTAVVSPGASIDEGCFTAQHLVLSDSSTLRLEIGGDPALTCLEYDRAIVLDTFTMGAASLLELNATASPPERGETYFVVTNQTSINGVFSNAPEGSTFSVDGVTMFVSYLLNSTFGAGIDVSLRANQLPVAVDDNYTVDVLSFFEPTPGVLFNDFDPDFDPLTATLETNVGPGEGTVNLANDGSFTYVSGGFVGVTTFTYTVTDGFEVSDVATVTLTVIPPTPTPSRTPSITSTQTSTSSVTPSRSASHTSTSTPTSTETPTKTPSSSSTATPTTTATPSETPTPSQSPTSSQTPTSSVTSSTTSTATPSETQTSTSTGTASVTSTRSPTSSSSTTATSSTTPSATKSSTATPTETSTPTSTLSSGSTPSATMSSTVTPSRSPTSSVTRTQSPTSSSSSTKSPSSSTTTTATPSSTLSLTSTPTSTRTPTATASSTSSETPSGTSTQTETTTPTTTASNGSSKSRTPSLTSSPTATLSVGASASTTNSALSTVSATVTAIVSAPPSPSSTGSGSVTATSSPSGTVSPTQSPSSTVTSTGTETPTSTPFETLTPTSSMSPTSTGTPSDTSSASATRTITKTSSSTKSSSASSTLLAIFASPSPTATTSRRTSASADIAAPQPASASPTPSKTLVLSISTSKSPTRTSAFGSSASRTPAPIGIGGNSPFGNVVVPVEITEVDGTSSRLVPILSESGSPVGSVLLPENVRGALVIASDTEAEIIDDVASVVLDVTVVGEDGQLITEFDEPIELCFNTDESEGDVCLGFYNDNDEWECEDYCLDASEEGLCGETSHLTSFALLLDSSAGSSDKCGSTSTDYLYVYLSVAAVGVALLIVLFMAVVVEVKARKKAARIDSSFKSMSRSTATLQND